MMKAAVLHEFAQPLVLEDVSAPQPRAGEILIQVEACGVCHSDVHIVDGDLPGFKAGTRMPLIPGHEVVGVVVAQGEGVAEPRIGQRVGVAWMHSACGVCEPCNEGLENVCRQGVVTGMMVDGGYGELMRARADFAIPVPEGLTPESAAPLFCAGVTVYRALRNAGVKAGQRVAVFGIGGLGHLAVQIAKAWGAEVIALDVAPDKLELARSLGAGVALDARERESLKQVAMLGGVHAAVVTSAARAAYDAALRTLRPAGVLTIVGLPAEPLQFAALGLVSGEFRIVGSAVGTRDDLREILAMAARGEVRCLVETRPLDEINTVLAQVREGRVQGRIVVRP